MPQAVLGLGSNISPAKENIDKAVSALADLGTVKEVSPYIISKPEGFTNQADFINAVVILSTPYQPKALLRKLKMLKLTSGLDSISADEKEKRISFSDAMTSIEGVPVSDRVKNDLANWKNGNITFLSVFEQTLRRYGFVTEV